MKYLSYGKYAIRTGGVINISAEEILLRGDHHMKLTYMMMQSVV